MLQRLKRFLRLERYYEVSLPLNKVNMSVWADITDMKSVNFQIIYYYIDLVSVENWLKDNDIVGEYHCELITSSNYNLEESTQINFNKKYLKSNPRMRFKNKKDAMLFKLTWL
jgi:hypothetical protein